LIATGLLKGLALRDRALGTPMFVEGQTAISTNREKLRQPCAQQTTSKAYRGVVVEGIKVIDSHRGPLWGGERTEFAA
jgi:hypothetical protein